MSEQSMILVIDVEEAIRESLIDILEFNGFHVLAADEGKRGIDLFQQHRAAIGLIILDMLMPGMSGTDTLRQLRRIDPTITILLSSGYDEDEISYIFDDAAIDQANTHFLQKPYSLTTVIGVTRSLLQKA